MNTAYLSLGSNMGNRHQNLLDAQNHIENYAGTIKQPLDSHTAAEALCGALFGIYYVRYIEDQLLQT